MPDSIEVIKSIQELLHVAVDGKWGPQSESAKSLLVQTKGPWPAEPSADVEGVHHVKASSFADPADITAFKRCRAAGNSEEFCFGKGDNGLGFGIYDTTEGSGPCCALPPEDWAQFGRAAHLKKVNVSANGITIVCELRDTMPHKKNIKNGAGIDLNPDACRALGLRPPIMVDAEWSWV